MLAGASTDSRSGGARPGFDAEHPIAAARSIRLLLVCGTREQPGRSAVDGTEGSWLHPTPFELLDMLGCADLGVECLHLSESVRARIESGEPSPPIGSARGLECRADPIDKHGLDVALSAGRHAAERAKLGGVELMVGLIQGIPSRFHGTADRMGSAFRFTCDPGVCRGDDCGPVPGDEPASGCPRSDPYDVLRRCARPEIAVLVGIAVACAQIGIPVCLPGPRGEIATLHALRLHPGVRAWIEPPVTRRSASERAVGGRIEQAGSESPQPLGRVG
jgi:hypothetical protein